MLSGSVYLDGRDKSNTAFVGIIWTFDVVSLTATQGLLVGTTKFRCDLLSRQVQQISFIIFVPEPDHVGEEQKIGQSRVLLNT